MHAAMAAPLTAAAAPYVARSLSLALHTCLRSATAFIFNRAKEELAAAAAAAAVAAEATATAVVE